MKRYDKRVLYIFSMLIFGSIGIFVQRLSMPSLHIAFARSLIGALTMLSFLVFSGRKMDREKIRRHFWALFFGGIFLGGNWIFLFEAYKRTGVTTATLVYYMAPVIFLMLSFFFMKLKLTPLRLITICLSFFGLFVLQMETLGTYAQMDRWGLFYGFVAAVLYALVMLTNRKMNGVSGVDRTAVELTVSFLILFFYMVFTGEMAAFHLPGKSLLYLLILGIIHTGLAYYIYFSVIDALDAQHVAMMSYADPLSAVIFSVIFLGEKIYLNLILGGLLILFASLLFEFAGTKERRRK